MSLKNFTLTLLLLSTTSIAIAEPLYWSARKDGRDLLLMGSIHVGRADMYPMPEYVNDYLNMSDGLITEIDPNSVQSPQFPQAEFSALDVLEIEEQRELKSRLKQFGLPSQLVNAPPWLSAVTLQMAKFSQLGYSAEDGIDRYYETKAKEIGLPNYGFETAESQLNVLNDLPNNGAALLLELIQEWEQVDAQLECQVASWKSGDKKRLLSMLEGEYYDKTTLAPLLMDRNKNWADMLESDWLPEQGRFLVVVGALHLIGEDNLPLLLKNRGWQVEQVSTSTLAQCDIN
ncbi:TraB/GumN family protein [Vibrio sp. SCSIO 43136]|uniref:TraB/GumN family protein n=1 Tax=Vibrio sp. SCSIO 43136 TaxID=2819101 RepID=UPI00207605BC|nr:TraB/GumN family protein [Vibrio sp. SCSIO 43136]USD64629.1 TraB/GumN family protein [Vibrio sp. SCSIO 43136]